MENDLTVNIFTHDRAGALNQESYFCLRFSTFRVSLVYEFTPIYINIIVPLKQKELNRKEEKETSWQ